MLIRDKTLVEWLTVFWEFDWGQAAPQLDNERSENRTSCKQRIQVNEPIPRIERGPIIELAFNTPNERHKICIRCIFNLLPSRITQTVARKARNEDFSIHFELSGVSSILSNATDDGVLIARHRGEIEGNEYFQRHADSRVVRVLDLGWLPPIRAYVQRDGIAI